MRAIHESGRRVAPVRGARGALSHGDPGNCAYYSSSFIRSMGWDGWQSDLPRGDLVYSEEELRVVDLAL